MKDADEGTSAYRLWYEFLIRTRTESDTWSEKVKRDFGGVLTMDFDSWFREVRLTLFAPYGSMIGGDGLWFKRRPVRSLFQGESTDDINFDTHFVLVIDRSQPHSVLEEKFKRHLQINANGVLDKSEDLIDSEDLDLEDLIDSEDLDWDNFKPTQRKRGARTWEESNALYPFKKRPDTDALEHVLHVHDLRRDNPTWKHWKIGVKAKERFENLLPLMKLVEGKEPSMEQKEILNAKVGYFLARAKKIKAGVINGIFPAV